MTLSGQRKIRSAIFKKPVKGKIFLDYLGFEGDSVADPIHHGGQDKAVCVYPFAHFPFWESELSTQLLPGAFGENLTDDGLTEKEVCIGDIFRIGEAEVQCSQPRQPCHKLVKIFDCPAMARKIQETGFSGYYMRVIKRGWMEPGLAVKRVHGDSARVSVEEANALMYRDKNNYEKTLEILQIDSLSSSWREIFEKRLASNNKPLRAGDKA